MTDLKEGGLFYLFVCDWCGQKIHSKRLVLTLVEDTMFVHDEGWEGMPDGWAISDKGLFLCPSCNTKSFEMP